MTTKPVETPSEGGGEKGQDIALSFEVSDFEDPRPRDSTFVVDVEGFEGPLDLLLGLARADKLDLTKISMLALAQQYLDFIAEQRQLRLELVADYLVMAAWLAFLKSKLLLPGEPEDDEPTGEELAAHLAFRLRHLEAMREASAKLMTRKRLGRDVFARGNPEGIRLIRSSTYKANVYDLLKAYAERRQRSEAISIRYKRRPVWSIKEARTRLEGMLGLSLDWTPIDNFLVQFLGDSQLRRSAVASSFGASLELACEGVLDLKQARAFAPLYLRTRQAEAD